MIRTNLNRLDRRLRRVSKRLGDFVADIQREVAVNVGDRLVPATPVDTGFARGNWVPGLNAPPILPTSTLDPQAVAAPARIRALAAQIRVGDVFYITNNAPYIELLNRGYSPQAAAGFVSREIAAGARDGVEIAVSNFRARNR